MYISEMSLYLGAWDAMFAWGSRTRAASVCPEAMTTQNDRWWWMWLTQAAVGRVLSCWSCFVVGRMFLCNWWFGVWNVEFFPMSWDDDPIWRTPSFFRGWLKTTNQVTMLNELWLVMVNEKTSQSDVATSPEWCARGGGYNFFHKNRCQMGAVLWWSTWYQHVGCTLWLFNIAMENDPFHL